MKVPLAVVFLGLTSWSSVGHCLSLEAYRKTLSQTKSDQTMVKYIAKATLLGYFQALSDSLTTMQHNGKLVMPNASDSPTEICVPPSVKIDKALVQLATDKEIEEHEDMYRASNPRTWEQLNLVTFTYIGLSRMFPCRAP